MSLLSRRGLTAARRHRPNTQFVYADSSGLILNGQPWVLYTGTTYKDLYSPDETVDIAYHMGLNTIDIVHWIDEYGNPDTEWSAPFNYEIVDGFMEAARQRGMKVIIDLGCFGNLQEFNGRNPLTVNWAPFFDFFANHVNTITGIKYKDDPIIVYYYFFSEPQGPAYYGLTDDQWVNAFRTILQAGKAADPNHLWSSGGLMAINEEGYPWRQVFTIPENDVIAIHIYWEGQLQGDPPILQSFCADVGKPWLLEEFGSQQTEGALEGGYPGSLPPGDGRRAETFDRVYSRARQYGCAGYFFWNLGYEVCNPASTLPAPYTAVACPASNTFDVSTYTPLTFQAVQRNSPPRTVGAGPVLVTSPPEVTNMTSAATTASFTPPAGALLVACVFGKHVTDLAVPQTISVSGGSLVWGSARKVTFNDPVGYNNGTVEVWRAVVGSNPAPMTVTATKSDPTGGIGLKVLVFTNAWTIGSTKLDRNSGIGMTNTLTTMFANSQCCAAIVSWTGGVPIPEAGQTLVSGTDIGPGVLGTYVSKVDAITSSAGTIVNQSMTFTGTTNTILFEVLAS